MFDLLERIGLDYRRLPLWVIRASMQTCRAVTGKNESWSSLAVSHDIKWLRRALGENHCGECNRFWRDG